MLALALALTLVGNISLVDQAGTHFALADLAGRPAVVTFVATRCKDVCPMADAIFLSLARERTAARFLTITLDPGYDTPFVMARHARDLHAAPDRWRLASGSPHDVERVLTAFGVVRDYDKDGIPDAHSSFIYVFDSRGRLAKTLPLSTNSFAEIRSDLKRATL